MTDDAGFAVAITIRQRMFNNGILAAYADGSFPRTLSHDLPLGPPAATIDVYLAPPQITCKADNTLTIAMQMWGSLSVTMTNVAETGDVAANLTLRIQPSFVIDNSNLAMQFDDVTSDVIATAWDFTVISGTGFSPAADSYLRSNPFRDRLQTAIQEAIAFGVVRLPTIDVSFLGNGILAAVKNMTAQSRVVGGALLLGLDIDTVDVTGQRISTTGDVRLLADFARTNDVAAVTSAVAVPVLLQQLQSQVSAKAGQGGATLEKLTITPQTGRFHVEGRASNSDGTANFSFNVIPGLYASRPGALLTYLPKDMIVKPRSWPALVFMTADSQVDADPATWLEVLSLVMSAINIGIPIIVFSMASQAASSLKAAIEDQPPNVIAPRVQHLKPAKPGGPTIRVEIADFEITTLGTYIGITVQPQAPPGALIGLTSIPSDYQTQTLSYRARLPLGIQSDDPKLRIRWTVIDQSGTVLVNEDDYAAGRETFTVVPQSVGPGLSELWIGVRVYRALGAQITDMLNDGITLNVRGQLSPGAYVRWYYIVKNEQVAFDNGSQSWHYAGTRLVNRHSNLHRTDQPCANASKRSRYMNSNLNPNPVVFNALPFPLADMELHRSELCDYCFYGGPAGIRPTL